MKSLTVDEKTLDYQITYKGIKHVYFRVKDGFIDITANKKFNETQVLDIFKRHFDKLYHYATAQKKIMVEKYQLFGLVLSESEFFKGMMPNDKNYEIILKKETEQAIKDLEPKLVEDLHKIGLNLVPTKVKKLKTKYGSCQIIKKVITINSFMAKLDIQYLYYVLLHEYAHLVVSNHSKSFYSVLDKVLNHHKNIQKNLRKHVIVF